MVVKASKVTGRRELHFATYDEIVADAEALAAVKTRALGNWSLGQVCQHLANTLNLSVDGFQSRPPLPIRVIARMFRGQALKKMSPGFKLPPAAAAELVAGPTETAAGLAALRAAAERVKHAPQLVVHPAFGRLTRAQWDQLHCRHAELHLSFILGDEG